MSPLDSKFEDSAAMEKFETMCTTNPSVVEVKIYGRTLIAITASPFHMLFTSITLLIKCLDDLLPLLCTDYHHYRIRLACSADCHAIWRFQ